MTTHDFNNQATQAERRRVERDTYLTRAQADADLTASGRFKRETATRVTGVPTYPSLPASSPWANGFDQNVEPAFGVDVNAMEPTGTPNEVRASIPTLKPPEVNASPAAVEDRVGERVGIPPPLVPTRSLNKRRGF